MDESGAPETSKVATALLEEMVVHILDDTASVLVSSD